MITVIGSAEFTVFNVDFFSNVFFKRMFLSTLIVTTQSSSRELTKPFYHILVAFYNMSKGIRLKACIVLGILGRVLCKGELHVVSEFLSQSATCYRRKSLVLISSIHTACRIVLFNSADF